MTITKEQWDKLDKVLPYEGDDWDGINIKTVLKILELIEKAEKWDEVDKLVNDEGQTWSKIIKKNKLLEKNFKDVLDELREERTISGQLRKDNGKNGTTIAGQDIKIKRLEKELDYIRGIKNEACEWWTMYSEAYHEEKYKINQIEKLLEKEGGQIPLCNIEGILKENNDEPRYPADKLDWEKSKADLRIVQKKDTFG